jgi:hypothetical protein
VGRALPAGDPLYLHPHRRLASLSPAALPRCRTCTGSHIPKTFHDSFPPCISSNELHQAWLAENRRYTAEVEAAYGRFAEAKDEASER